MTGRQKLITHDLVSPLILFGHPVGVWPGNHHVDLYQLGGTPCSPSETHLPLSRPQGPDLVALPAGSLQPVGPCAVSWSSKVPSMGQGASEDTGGPAWELTARKQTGSFVFFCTSDYVNDICCITLQNVT